MVSCVCTHVHVFMFVCVSMCVCRCLCLCRCMEAKGQSSVLFVGYQLLCSCFVWGLVLVLDRFLLVSASPSRPRWLANEPQRCVCLCFLGTGITTYAQCPPLLPGFWDSNLGLQSCTANYFVTVPSPPAWVLVFLLKQSKFNSLELCRYRRKGDEREPRPFLTLKPATLLSSTSYKQNS